MKHIAVIFRSAPHKNGKAREGLEFAMLAANMDQQVSLVFVDEGVFNLLAQQQPELIGNKDYIAAFKATPFYDIEPIIVCNNALSQYGLTNDDLIVEADIVDNEQIRHHLHAVDEVLVF